MPRRQHKLPKSATGVSKSTLETSLDEIPTTEEWALMTEYGYLALGADDDSEPLLLTKNN
jgi:hypothetical protein